MIINLNIDKLNTEESFKLNLLEWDTKFFGFKVTKVVLNNFKKIEENILKNYENNVKLIYVYTNKSIPLSLLSKYNGLRVDNKLTFEKKITQGKSHENLDVIIEYSNKYSVNELYELAFLSGTHSRFNVDFKIGKNKFKELYKTWVDNSINGKIASKVFIYVMERKIIGFITVMIKDNYGEIGLLAVKESSQGKRIGSNLILKVENFLLSKGIKILKVPTQENNRLAVNFYKRNNFGISKKEIIYHFWNNL